MIAANNSINPKSRRVSPTGRRRIRKGPLTGRAEAGDWHSHRTWEGYVSVWRIGRGLTPLEDQNPLAMHAQWCGPVKLVGGEGEGRDEMEQRLELFVGAESSPGESCFDQEEKEDRESLIKEFLVRAPEFFAGGNAFEDWTPPETEALCDWLKVVGHDVARDKHGHLRFAIHRRGCDGQVRLLCGPGRLRFEMPLGSWRNLTPTSQSAMLRLAREANDHTRLARIAWLSGETTRCVAQVDLTGLPGTELGNAAQRAMWEEMVQKSAAGLELVLRRLGIELPVLADPRHDDLAQWLLHDE